MKRKIVRNPAELQIITNPHEKPNTMAKLKPTQTVKEFSDQAKNAFYILGGQAAAATGNALVIPKLLENQPTLAKQIARVALPGLAGIILASTKNKHMQQAALGFGVQSTLELIKFVMPDFNPAGSLLDDSAYVYPQQRAMLPPDIPVAPLPAPSQESNLIEDEGLVTYGHDDEYEQDYGYY